MLKLIRSGRHAIGGAMLIASLIAFLSSNQFATLKLAFRFWDPFSISEYRLSRLSREDYEVAIEQALNEEDLEDAQALVTIAQENGHEVHPDLLERTQENGFESSYRFSKGFLAGAVYGDITNWPSLLGSMTADTTGIGDLRDTAVQGGLMVMGEEYDSLTLGFSLVGIATSVVSWVPGGQAMIVGDTGLSILKNTNKARKLSTPLVKHLSEVASRLINKDGLKRGLSQLSTIEFKKPSISAIGASFNRVDWYQVAKGDVSQVKGVISELVPIDAKRMKSAFTGSINNHAAKEVTVLATAVGGIASSGGTRAAMRAMEYSDNVKDLSRFKSLASRMGKKTASVTKLLGKNAINLGKLFYVLVSILMVVLGWVLGAIWFLYTGARTAYRLSKRLV